MSSILDSNYPNKVPVSLDYMLFTQADGSANWTATMQQFANLFQQLASLNLKPVVISGDTTLSTQQLVVVDSSGSVALTLPDSALNSGRGFRIFNKGAGTVTIGAAGTDTIAGNASLVLAQNDSVTLYSDGIGMWATF